MAKEPKDFGDNLYIVKVSKGICENKEIAIYADSIVITDTGDLIFSFTDGEGDEQYSAGFQKNEWIAFYQADRKNQCPLTIQRWHGVAGIKVIERIIPSEPIEKVVEKIMIYDDVVAVEEPTEENTKPD